MLNRRLVATLCVAGISLANAHAEDAVPVKTASLSTPITASPIEDKTDIIQELSGQEAVEYQITKLESIVATLSAIDGYTAVMHKQERVDGDLSSEQRIDLKLRHADEDAGVGLSIYMKWLAGDRGREVIYVDGENNNKLLVHAGGWKARILPVLALDPNGSLAMAESRHPITNAGLLNLAQTWLRVRKQDVDGRDVEYRVEPSEFDGHSGQKFTVIYKNREQSEIYRKCELWIDTERNIPLAAVNYTWGTRGNDDAQTLVEKYEYIDVALNPGLSDVDFDRTNRRYSFKK